MLRTVVGVLLLVNLLFFGWARGWFAPGWPPPRQGEREPARLAAQVNPERIVVVPSRTGASAGGPGGATAGNANAACLEAGPFADTDLAAAEAAISQAGIPADAWLRLPEPAAPAGRQWVRIPQTEAGWLPKLQALPAAVVGAGFARCAPR